MFGIITLKGVQVKNRFVDEIGKEYHINNYWVSNKVYKFVTLIKSYDDTWEILRQLELGREIL